MTQKTVHSCPNCMNTVGVHSFYDLLSLTDKVISYQIGNFAVIVNRKQLLGIFIFFLFIFGFYFIFNNLSFERDENFLDVDWETYKSICSKEKHIENPTQADILCTRKFKYHNVFWKGRFNNNLGWVIRVDYDDRIFTRYRVSVLIKMDNNENEDADIYLKFDDHYYQKYKPTFLNMTRGDFLSYNATIMFTGNQKFTSIFEGFGIKQETGHIFIHPHIHHNGRYSIKEEKHAHKDDQLYPELPNLLIDKDVDIAQLETNH